MALPLLMAAGIGAAAGGVLGGLFGSSADDEARAIEKLVAEYKSKLQGIEYYKEEGIASVLNAESLTRGGSLGLADTFMTDFGKTMNSAFSVEYGSRITEN